MVNKLAMKPEKDKTYVQNLENSLVAFNDIHDKTRVLLASAILIYHNLYKELNSLCSLSVL